MQKATYMIRVTETLHVLQPLQELLDTTVITTPTPTHLRRRRSPATPLNPHLPLHPSPPSQPLLPGVRLAKRQADPRAKGEGEGEGVGFTLGLG